MLFGKEFDCRDKVEQHVILSNKTWLNGHIFVAYITVRPLVKGNHIGLHYFSVKYNQNKLISDLKGWLTQI